MKTIAIANQKGGCGKTTTAINMAAALGTHGKRVLLIDMDPQGHASLGLGLRCDEQEGLYEVFLREATLEEVIVHDVAQGVDLVPGSISLAAVEHVLAESDERERRLLTCLAPFEERYDFVIIDCPPSLGLLSFNALRAADEVVIPIELSVFSLDGVERLRETIDLLCEKYQIDLPVRMLPTMVDMRPRLYRDLLRDLRETFPQEVSQACIHYTIKLKEAALQGVSVVRYDPVCIAARDYDRLAREVLGEDVSRVRVTAFVASAGTARKKAAVAAAVGASAGAGSMLAQPSESEAEPVAETLRYAEAMSGDDVESLLSVIRENDLPVPEPATVLQPANASLEPLDSPSEPTGTSLELADALPEPTQEETSVREVARPGLVSELDFDALFLGPDAMAAAGRAAADEARTPSANDGVMLQAAIDAVLGMGGGGKLLAHRSEWEAPSAANDAGEYREIVLTYAGSDAGDLQIAGEFNNWVPDQGVVTSLEDGVLRKTIRLTPGTYEYRVIVNGIWQADPANPNRVLNTYGDHNSLLDI